MTTTAATLQAFRPGKVVQDGRRVVSYAFDLRHLGADDAIVEAVLEFDRDASATRVFDVSGSFAYGNLSAAHRRARARIRLGRFGLSDLSAARGAFFWVQHEMTGTDPADAVAPPQLRLSVASRQAAMPEAQAQLAA